MRALGQWVVLIILAAAIGFSMFKENPESTQPQTLLLLEHAEIGKALAKGDGFADPFGPGTGPSAWFAPATPAVVGAVYKSLTPDTHQSNLALLGIKALALALAAGLFWGAGKRWDANRQLLFVLLFATGLFTNYEWLTRVFADQWLVILWSGFLVFGMSNLSAGRGKFLCLLAGLGAPFVSPALTVGLLVTLFCKGLFEKRAAFLILFATLLSTGAWVGRNFQTLKVPYPIISSFGYRLYQSNVLDRDGVLSDSTLSQYHPREALSTFRAEYSELGEKEFGAVYRVRALESYEEDPEAFKAKVIARAKNAFFFMDTPHDLAPSATTLNPADGLVLREAQLVLPTAGPEIWTNLDWSEADLKEVLALRPLEDPTAALTQWKKSVDNVAAMRMEPLYKARGFGFALLPILAMFIGVLRGGLVRPGFRDPAFLYIFYLLPYVLFEHYTPHQLAAVGLQAWLVHVSLFSGYLGRSKGEVDDEDEAPQASGKKAGRSKSSSKGGTFKPVEHSTVEIEVENEDGDFRSYFVEILAVDKKQMTLPRPGTVLSPVELVPGDTVTLSYFDEAKSMHYSYQPEVLEVMDKEFVITVPKAKKAVAVPIAPRDDDFKVEAEFSVMYSAHRSTHRQVATTQAVTPNSLFLRTNLAVPPQTTLRMKLELPLRVEVDIEGKALFSEKDPNDERKHICEVPFETIEPEGREKMLMFAVYYQQRVERSRAR